MLDGVGGVVGTDGVGCVGDAGRTVAGPVGVAGRAGAGGADGVGGVGGLDAAIAGRPDGVDVIDASFGPSIASSAACITSWRLWSRVDTALMSNSGGADGVGAKSAAVGAGPASVSSAEIHRSKF